MNAPARTDRHAPNASTRTQVQARIDFAIGQSIRSGGTELIHLPTATQAHLATVAHALRQVAERYTKTRDGGTLYEGDGHPSISAAGEGWSVLLIGYEDERARDARAADKASVLQSGNCVAMAEIAHPGEDACERMRPPF